MFKLRIKYLYAIVYFISFVLVQNIQSADTSAMQALKAIFENKNELKAIFDSYAPVTCSHIIPIRFFEKTLKSFCDESFEKWEEKDVELFSAILDVCLTIRSYEANSGSVVNNLTLMKVLEKILSLNTEAYKKCCMNAHKVLLINTSYQLLQDRSSQLKTAINNNVNIEQKDRIKLLALLKLTKEEKTEILKNKRVPPYIRARLGDSAAEDSLIALYPQISDFRKKETLVQELLYIGSQKCIKTLIECFNQPVFDMQGKCVSESIRFPILVGLRKLYPEVELFDMPLQMVTHPICSRKNGNISENVKKYVDQFKLWAKDNYNVVPKDPDPLPILKGDCMMISPIAKPKTRK